MPRLFLLPALLLAAAAAPTTAQERPPLTPDQEAALYGIPAAVSFGGALLLVNVAEGSGAQLLILATPLVAGASVCGMGRLTRAAGSCRGALLGGALGALPGLALAGSGRALGESGLTDDWTALGLVVLGAIAYAVVPPFTALHGYRRSAPLEAAPALRFAPGSRELTAGLSLRAAF